MGKGLQVIITGSYFYGPDPRWPDRTDEMDPMINCLVVDQVNDGEIERLTAFAMRFFSCQEAEMETNRYCVKVETLHPGGI